MNCEVVAARLTKFFEVVSGDYHATRELDAGRIPLISCGEKNQGLVGHFTIPRGKTYQRAVTVAYNGRPLTATFHPYRFAAKDDVAVLVPRQPMADETLVYVAAMLNRLKWRYSYNRKCFREKLRNVRIHLPVASVSGEQVVDQGAIASFSGKRLRSLLPGRRDSAAIKIPRLRWRNFSITALFGLERGDFHSLRELDPGSYVTVSRVTDDNGVKGFFARPDGARVYRSGLLTVSTVGGDAFVQLSDFIATDNVVICTPKQHLRITTVFFVAFILNRQKWRYSYGRQCYKEKLATASLQLPVSRDGALDEERMQSIVEASDYWAEVRDRFRSCPGNVGTQ